MAVAVAVSGGLAVAVAVLVAGLTKRLFNQIQTDFLSSVWGYDSLNGSLTQSLTPTNLNSLPPRLLIAFLGNGSQMLFPRKAFLDKPGGRSSRTVVGGAPVVSGAERKSI